MFWKVQFSTVFFGSIDNYGPFSSITELLALKVSVMLCSLYNRFRFVCVFLYRDFIKMFRCIPRVWDSTHNKGYPVKQLQKFALQEQMGSPSPLHYFIQGSAQFFNTVRLSNNIAESIFFVLSHDWSI